MLVCCASYIQHRLSTLYRIAVSATLPASCCASDVKAFLSLIQQWRPGGVIPSLLYCSALYVREVMVKVAEQADVYLWILPMTSMFVGGPDGVVRHLK